jgi:uncharacterized protein (DUF1330 family)
MKHHRLLLAGVSLCCGVAQGVAVAATTLVDQNAKVTHAYVLMQAQMEDPDTFFTKYAIPAEVEVVKNGGIALLGTLNKQVIEGRWDNNWTLVLKFPSLQAINTWYDSAGYQAVVPYRHQATSYGNMVAFEGVPESAIEWRVDRFDNAKVVLQMPNTLDRSPDFVVTAAIASQGGPASFALTAGVTPIDASNAALSLELSGDSDMAKSVGDVSVSLRDTAGRRLSLGLRRWQAAPSDGWTRLVFPIPPMPAVDPGLPRSRRFQLNAVNAVDIEWSGIPGTSTRGQQHIRIRRLAVAR